MADGRIAAADPVRAAELRSLGQAAYRAGNPARARGHFERALGLFRAALGDNAPDTLGTLSDLGAACATLGDHAAACAAHEAALAGRRAALGHAHPEVAVSLQNLGAVHRAQGDLPAAEACHAEAAAIFRATLGDTHPLLAKALASLCALALDRGDGAAAIPLARNVLDIRTRTLPAGHPAMIAAMDDLGHAQAISGDQDAACTTWAAALRALPRGGGPIRANLHLNSGVSCNLLGLPERAAKHFEAALVADANLTTARHSLARTLLRLGRTAEAKPHRDRALREQNVFVQGAAASSLSVLILSVADDGNIPLDHLLPEHDFTRIWWFIDHVRDAPEPGLPAYDVILNAIADPDTCPSFGKPVTAFLADAAKPILNHPARVAETRRDRLPARLHGIAGLVAPTVVRVDNPATPQALAQSAAQAGLELPLLLRPAGSHGGAGLTRISAWADLAAIALQAAPSWYLAPFHDTRSPDGYYRKYRAIFVDRVPYPYHLAISPNWLVHYYTSDMAAHTWKLQEEARFLDDPAAVLGTSAMRALEQAALAIDLEYCGIDFTQLPSGDILVFEANATMLVHPEADDGPLAFKNRAVRTIKQAMRTMMRDGLRKRVLS